MLEKIKAKRHAKARQKFEMEQAELNKKKLKSGGAISEKKSHPQLDKLKRGGKHGTKVNVIVAPQGGASRLPVVPPQGVPPMSPMAPAMKKGGAVHMTAGAGSGEGRLEKTEIHKKKK